MIYSESVCHRCLLWFIIILHVLVAVITRSDWLIEISRNAHYRLAKTKQKPIKLYLTTAY